MRLRKPEFLDQAGVHDLVGRGVPGDQALGFGLVLRAEPATHPQEMIALVVDHAGARAAHLAVHAGALDVQAEVPVDAALEDVGERQHLEGRDRRADVLGAYRAW